MSIRLIIIELPKSNQSVLGWYGQGYAGHSHDQLKAEGEVAVLPSMGILLFMTSPASLVSPTHDQSPKMCHFLPRIFFCT